MSISLTVAFAAGLVSFLSPCVLPVIPGFIAYLAGTSVEDASTNRGETLKHALLFVAGFALVFTMVSILLATVLDAVAYTAQKWFARIGGTFIIVFGLYLTNLLEIPFLDKTRQINVAQYDFSSRSLASFVFGAAFAVGWTPCVGAALGAVLGLAASQPATALPLLLTYATGLGVPFLFVGVFTHESAAFFRRHANSFRYIQIGFGVFLLVLGVLVFTQELTRLASFGLVEAVIGELP